ncbi:MAG: 50S ribosome-binding GTPase [Myxococcaceae bacterium]|nr:50S ribosome-binding GTPase [Myxococcaceae bacterium]
MKQTEGLFPVSSTIVAIATGPATGAVGIVRLSGPAAVDAVAAITRGLPSPPTPRFAHRVTVVAADGAALDDGLCLVFPAPRSLTGETVVELQLHGSPRLLALVQARLLEHPTVRLADPGEFTRRAWVNGKVDLTRAQAVAALVEARSERAVRAAAAALGGATASRLGGLERALRALHAEVEAALEFPQDVEDHELTVAPRLAALRADAEALATAAGAGALLSREPAVVLYGPVNAGKSTLFNALLGEERALVDPSPGTTRDVLEARVEWQGLGLQLKDTAGLRDGAQALEARGIARGRAALDEAALAVCVVPAGAARAPWEAEVLAERRLDVASKSDLHAEGPGLRVHQHDGKGLEALRRAIVARLAPTADLGVLLSDRQRASLEQLRAHLGAAAEAERLSTLEVVAGELALASAALAELTGTGAGRDVLDEVFARFCIGK